MYIYQMTRDSQAKYNQTKYTSYPDDKGRGGSMSLSPMRRGLQKGCTRLPAASDKVYQLLAYGRWFSPGTLASSTTKTGRPDIAEILLNVALNTKNQLSIPLDNHISSAWTTLSFLGLNTVRGCHGRVVVKFITFYEIRTYHH